MTLILATATQKEMKAVLKGFNGRGRIGCQLPSPGQWVESPVNEHACLLTVTGVGPLNAAFTLGRILGEHFGVRGVINLGVAGSFDTAAHPLCSTVLADREIFPEYGLRTEAGVDPAGIAFPQWQDPGCDDESTEDQCAPVWDSIALSPAATFGQLELNTPDAPCAASLTVSGVSGTEAQAKRFRARYNAGTENMEGFALALGCVQAGIPFAELRTISNVVGSRAPADWRLDDALTALGSAARSLFI